MIERPKILSKAQIREAEMLRASGDYRRARNMMGVIRDLYFPTGRTDVDDQSNYLAASRILVSSSLSDVRAQKTAQGVVKQLHVARQDIIDIYDNPHAQTAASRVKTGIDGAPCDYPTEMRRDRIAYTLTLAALTGNPELLARAITEMDAAIAEVEEPTAKTLLRFEKQRLAYQAEPTGTTRAALTISFNDATQAALQVDNKKRAATIAARYIVDIEDGKKPEDVSEHTANGYVIYARTVAGQEHLANIIKREREKKRTEKTRHTRWQREWQRDFTDADLAKLQLPEYSFNVEDEAELWTRTIKLPSKVSIDLLKDTFKEYVKRKLAQGRITPILGYLIENADGTSSFHMTQYPDHREDRPPMLLADANTDIAEELAALLGGEVTLSNMQTSDKPLMATVGTREGYGATSFIHDREKAHRLLAGISIQDAHMISVRPKYDETEVGQTLVLEEYDEPVELVFGGREIYPQIKWAAYQLGQWHIPIENYTTNRITMYSTSLAEAEE